MLHTDPTFAEAVSEAVTEIEQHTDVELVVVAARRSSDYRLVPLLASAVVTWVALGFMLFEPYPLSETTVWLDTFLVFVVCGWLCSRDMLLDPMLGMLPAYTRSTVRAAAQRAFIEEAVHATPRRTGLLIYVSAVEGHIEVLYDLGVEGSIPHGHLDPAIDALTARDVPAFLTSLRALGDVLATYMPARDDSDGIGLPNAPRVRR